MSAVGSVGSVDEGIADREDPDGIETPTLRRGLRRAAPWLVLVAAVVLVAVVLLVISLRPQSSSQVLAADNPGPSGAQALARVLQQQGVDVSITRTLRATEAAVDDPADTTVLLFDPDELLSTRQHDRLAGTGAADLVLVAPSYGTVGDLAPGVAVAGRTTDTLRADCDVTAVRRAGTVSGSAILYDAAKADDATSCLRHGTGAALVELRIGEQRVTLLGAAAALENGTITQDGDAALALGLLGRHHHLVWYLPSLEDVSGPSSASLADLTPAWVTPFVLLLLVGAVAAAVWRGRRMGRVVVENLPVEVRSRETMEGRARLYERVNARAHALDAIRIGTVSRLARTLGMPRSASVDEVADAVAAALGRPRDEVAGILVDALPRSDAELVALSDALDRLEQDTARAVRP